MENYFKISRQRLLNSGLWVFLIFAIPLNFLYNYLYVQYGFNLGIKYPFLLHGLLFFVFLFFIFNINYFNFNKKYFYLFIFFALYVAFVSLLNFTYFDYALDSRVFFESLFFLLYFLAFSISGRLVYEKNKSFILLFFIFFLLVLLNFDGMNLIAFSLDTDAGDSEGHINYQLVSLFFMLTWFFFFFSVENLIVKICSTIVLLFLLLTSGGRSELVGFVVSLSFLIFNFFFSKGRLLNKLFFISIISISLILLFYRYYEFIDNLFMNSRHAQILDFSNSSSWEAREYIYRQNINYIYNNPFFGAYGSHFRSGEGHYIHNMLSAWQQYGLIGFLAYFLLLFIPFFHSLLIFYKEKHDENIYPLIFISTFCLFLCLVTKPVFWPYAGLSVGVYFAYMQKRNINNKGY
ncbi:O-antigen ligase family protein [Acinetobacter amyesii]|uniref:O-antigen ligase family protein n=1 Tax=Acinetobacter amyesii TaxID=2942470 RepID=UPI0020BDC5FD|nr:O-antigen ligase family protein [Acinetobacter amyesii]MCL6231126.1 O-antigen ligase family protein [Acinetobacter amyesii]